MAQVQKCIAPIDEGLAQIELRFCFLRTQSLKNFQSPIEISERAQRAISLTVNIATARQSPSEVRQALRFALLTASAEDFDRLNQITERLLRATKLMIQGRPGKQQLSPQLPFGHPGQFRQQGDAD